METTCKYNVTLKDEKNKIYQVETVGKDKKTAVKNAKIEIYNNDNNQVNFLSNLKLVLIKKDSDIKL